MNVGVLGLPQSGKTTLFHLLTNTEADPSAAFKREVLKGICSVPDARVDKLSEMLNSKKSIYVTVEYVDTPGMEAGASKTEWFSGAIAGGLKTSDALLLVVRAFGADEMQGGINPERDILQIQDELIFSDLVILESKLERLSKQSRVRTPTGDEKLELDLLARGKAQLEAGKPLRAMQMDANEKRALRGYQLLSEKPLLAVINASEDTLKVVLGQMDKLTQTLEASHIKAIALSVKLEAEIANLEGEEREMFMNDLGVSELARDRVLQASFDLLGLHCFLTTGEKESRAWQIHKGDNALEAAGAIHSDLAKGFIRAEVVHYDDYVREGGYPGCKTKGLLRLEGKEYVVKNGDILVIRHSS